MSTQSPELNAQALALLREAAAWRLISLLFACPDEAWHDQVARLALEVADADLKAAAEAAREQATPERYHSAFGPGGPAPPREVSYCDTILPGQRLAQLQAFYEAFAYAPSCQEPPDHVSIETSFVGYLHLKETYALLRGEADHAAVTDEAVECFLDDHLSVLAEPMAESLKTSGLTYLVLAAGALLRRVGPPRTTASGPGGGLIGPLPVLAEPGDATLDGPHHCCL